MVAHHDLAARDPEAGVSVLLVRFQEGVDRDAAVAQLREEFPLTVLVAPVPSRSVQTLDGLTILPVALATTVTLLAVAAAANGSLTSVRRRRRDLAVLKVVGMPGRQVRGVVRYQAVAWAVAALVVGVPAGLVAGAVGWRQVLRSLGLDAPLTPPATAIVAVLVAAPALLVALTWWPGRQAATTAPAITLRSE
jgi:putative ABC transport system permease protein